MDTWQQPGSDTVQQDLVASFLSHACRLQGSLGMGQFSQGFSLALTRERAHTMDQMARLTWRITNS
jgi:hypothetical protein